MTKAFTYNPAAGRFSGVQPRDLTQADYEALGPRERRIVRLATAPDGTPAYAPAAAPKEPDKMTRDELNAYAAERGVANPETFGSKSDLLAALSGEEG